MKTEQELMIAGDEILIELGKLEKEILNNLKKNQKNDLGYQIERSRTIAALTAKLNLINWILND